VQRRGAPAHRTETQTFSRRRPVSSPRQRPRRRQKFSDERHAALRARGQPRLSYTGMRDLKWWATLASNPHVGREVWPAPTATMFTDASMRGWGAVWNGKVPVSGLFTAANEGSSINELELLAAIHGLRSFPRFARARELTLVSDSLVTMHIVRNWTSRAPHLLSHLRTLRAVRESLGVTLSTRHLQSVLNLWADRLSRRRDSTSWGLSHTSALLLAQCLKAQLLDGDGLQPRARAPAGTLRSCCPDRPIWHRHLSGIARGFLIAPAWHGQDLFQDSLRRARVAPLETPVTPPWPSVMFDYGRHPSLPPKPGKRLG
jgi:ribonuclease HI